MLNIEGQVPFAPPCMSLILITFMKKGILVRAYSIRINKKFPPFKKPEDSVAFSENPAIKTTHPELDKSSPYFHIIFFF